MLAFENVTKEFRLDEENTITPVRNVTLEVRPGELIVILGRSGTGKTTLLNLAAGLVHPTSGRVLANGADLATMSDRQVSALRSKAFGFVFQFPSLIPALTIQDNVSLPAIFKDGEDSNEAAAKAVRLLTTLGLESKTNVFPKQLSAGEQKRVIIARAMMNDPRLVLADEPTSDLDGRTEKEVMAFLRDINSRGAAFLIVTHSQELVKFAARAFEMDNGNLSEITRHG